MIRTGRMKKRSRTASKGKFKVQWSNDHACGTFPYTFDSEGEAERWVREWKRDMVNIEPPSQRASARREYQWEVVEVLTAYENPPKSKEIG